MENIYKKIKDGCYKSFSPCKNKRKEGITKQVTFVHIPKPLIHSLKVGDTLYNFKEDITFIISDINKFDGWLRIRFLNESLSYDYSYQENTADDFILIRKVEVV